jgi:hypothetical protein
MLMLGAALGAVLVGLAEWRGGRTTNRIYGWALVVAALVYVGFALAAGTNDWWATEVGGVLVFGALVVAGIRRYPYMLALGWALHVGWDTLLHTGLGTDFVPEWYVPLCVGFDLIVAGAILVSTMGNRD